MNPIQVPNDGGKQVNVIGIPIVIRVHGRDTGGALSVVESHDVPGGGPPPHIHHREDETFQVLEGEYEWTVGAAATAGHPTRGGHCKKIWAGNSAAARCMMQFNRDTARR